MKKRNSTKTIAFIALMIAIISISVSYAAISRTVIITGTTTMDPNLWKVEFDKESLSEAIVTGNAAVEIMDPIIISDTSITLYNVSLRESGDSVSYTFDVKNTGEKDVKIGSIDYLAPTYLGIGDTRVNDENIVRNYLKFQIVYADTGKSINIGDSISASDKYKLKMIISYDSSMANNIIPENKVVVSNLGVNITYVEK